MQPKNATCTYNSEQPPGAALTFNTPALVLYHQSCYNNYCRCPFAASNEA